MVFDDRTRLMRTTGPFDPFQQCFDLGVGYGSTTVNQHRLEAVVLNALGRPVRVSRAFSGTKRMCSVHSNPRPLLPPLRPAVCDSAPLRLNFCVGIMPGLAEGLANGGRDPSSAGRKRRDEHRPAGPGAAGDRRRDTARLQLRRRHFQAPSRRRARRQGRLYRSPRQLQLCGVGGAGRALRPRAARARRAARRARADVPHRHHRLADRVPRRHQGRRRRGAGQYAADRGRLPLHARGFPRAASGRVRGVAPNSPRRSKPANISHM